MTLGGLLLCRTSAKERQLSPQVALIVAEKDVRRSTVRPSPTSSGARPDNPRFPSKTREGRAQLAAELFKPDVWGVKTQFASRKF